MPEMILTRRLYLWRLKKKPNSGWAWEHGWWITRKSL